MQYRLIDRTITFELICQKEFEKLFFKYKTNQTDRTDIFIRSFWNEEITFSDLEILISDPTYAVYHSKNQELFVYTVFERGHAIGKVECNDKDGNYQIYVCRGENPYYVEYLMVQCALSRYFLHHLTAIFIHSSCFCYQNKAIMVSAPSGTGKSTHVGLWKKYYDIAYINDDKNFIVLEGDKPYVYGTPISGKHHLDENIKAELVGLVFLKQAPENRLKKLPKMEAFTRLLAQIQIPYNDTNMQKIMPIIDLILDFPCYELECTISKEAVELVKNAYFKGEEDNDK